eukprot:8204000-Pyramimonas_sp.AAC.1
MAATETVWDGSAEARTDLARKKNCALEVTVTPSTSSPPASFSTSTSKLRSAFPPQDGKLRMHLQWPV